ncbi:MAG TPA: hypothetical protein VGX03_30555, partial [Candidatus Binatia bacterium]|nr:hypothetical protein [Candidatus Binatia bacterium]
PPHLRLGDSVRVTARERHGLTTFRRLDPQTGVGRLCTPGETARAAGDRYNPPSLLPLPFWVWSHSVA